MKTGRLLWVALGSLLAATAAYAEGPAKDEQAAPTLTQPPAVADDICYDRAVVGHIVDAENFVGLDHFVQAAPSSFVLGGRWDIDIGVD